MTYETLFVDLDDTLYPYPECNEAGKRAAWKEARELGYDLDREAFGALYHEARREVKRELVGTASAHERFLYFKRAIQIHTGTHSARDALALGETYWGTYVETMELFDGVEETLAELHDAGVEIAVVSNLTTRLPLEKIAHLGIEPYLDLVVTSEETGREKPSSVMFTLPLAQLDRRPSEAVMVGNSVASDVEGANAVGLTTVLFNAEEDPDDLAGHQQPDHHVEEFSQLREVVL